MRKTLACVLAVCAAMAAGAQPLIAKKGKINAGDSTVAKYDSKGGMFRAYSIHIKSVADEPVLDLKEEGYDFESPYAVRTAWYRISFPNSEIPVLRYRMREQLTEKLIFAQVLLPESAPLLLRDGTLNRAVVSTLAAGPDAYDFAADSARVRTLEADNAARIKKIVPRDISKPIDLRRTNVTYPNTGTGENTVHYDIYQEGLLLGSVAKRRYPENGNLHVDYSVSMKTAPYTVDGKEVDLSPLAFMNDASPVYENKLILMKDKTKLKLKTPDAANAEWTIVKFLIDTGNL